MRVLIYFLLIGHLSHVAWAEFDEQTLWTCLSNLPGNGRSSNGLLITAVGTGRAHFLIKQAESIYWCDLRRSQGTANVLLEFNSSVYQVSRNNLQSTTVIDRNRLGSSARPVTCTLLGVGNYSMALSVMRPTISQASQAPVQFGTTIVDDLLRDLLDGQERSCNHEQTAKLDQTLRSVKDKGLEMLEACRPVYGDNTRRIIMSMEQYFLSRLDRERHYTYTCLISTQEHPVRARERPAN